MNRNVAIPCLLCVALGLCPSTASADEPAGVLVALIHRLARVADRAVRAARARGEITEAESPASASELAHVRRAALDLDLPQPIEPSLHRSDLERVPRVLISLMSSGIDIGEHASNENHMRLQVRPRGNGARVRLSVHF